MGQEKFSARPETECQIIFIGRTSAGNNLVAFDVISNILPATPPNKFSVLQRLTYISCLTDMSENFMLTKKRIIVVIGIIVAILITFYTGVFGISTLS